MTSLKRLTPANLFLLGLTLLGLLAFITPFLTVPAQSANPDGAHAREALLVLSGVLALCLLGLVAESQRGLTATSLAMLGALAGVNAVLRLIENVMPLPGGFSPVFLLIALVGYVFGARAGFLMGALTLFVSALITAGIGPWLPYQMLAAGWMGMGAAWLPHPRRGSPAEVFMLAGYGFVWGFLYGALTNLYFWPYVIGAPDISWSPGLPFAESLRRYGAFYLVSSAVWDSLRAAGNLILLGSLSLPLLKVLRRFERRAAVRWLDSPPSNLKTIQ